VRRFPDGPLIQISDRGAQLRWSQDGSEIFYMAFERKLMTVKSDSRNGLRITAKAVQKSPPARRLSLAFTPKVAHRRKRLFRKIYAARRRPFCESDRFEDGDGV
jgi:hypothetical protein